MLKRIIILAAIVGIPLGVWIASTYGQLTEVTFAVASSDHASGVEGDQAPKVIIVSTIVNAAEAPERIACTDHTGAAFRVQYTGSTPDEPFANGQVVRFVGHVHDGHDSYFHATQVYAQ
jgi:cytochrome c-type biogenesis protein CcmE